MSGLSLYVHIPFCRSKCGYCDFRSFAGQSSLIPRYFAALWAEIDEKAAVISAFPSLDTIYFGGGTPSLPDSRYIRETLSRLGERFRIAADAEITVEANPESLDAQKLHDYSEGGVNRLSLGAQSLDDAALKALGRAHDRAGVLRAVENARSAGFENIGLDLMFGLPNQSLALLERDLREIVSLGPSHVSAYSLTIEAGTPFAASPPPLPDEALEREMYARVREYLGEHGYSRYEISNFARKGRESRHNTAYWTDRPYLGLGLAAHSYIDYMRFHNTYVMSDYINGDFSRHEPEEITESARRSEFMFLGLRLAAGVSKRAFLGKFGTPVEEAFGSEIKKCLSAGLLLEAEDTLRLSDRGLDLANVVFREFV